MIPLDGLCCHKILLQISNSVTTILTFTGSPRFHWWIKFIKQRQCFYCCLLTFQVSYSYFPSFYLFVLFLLFLYLLLLVFLWRLKQDIPTILTIDDLDFHDAILVFEYLVSKRALSNFTSNSFGVIKKLTPYACFHPFLAKMLLIHSSLLRIR